MTVHPALFSRLFDDAAVFPPGNAPLRAAVIAHREHGERWYRDMVGPFVCDASRLDALAREVISVARGPLAVSLVVPEGVPSLRAALGRVESSDEFRLAAVEIAVEQQDIIDAVSCVRAARPAAPVYLEVAARSIDLGVVGQLADHGLALKLRTGGTRATAFPAIEALAHAILLCVRTGAAFKCTAGLHHAVRHRDEQTGFEHHGFLNVLAAVGLALDGADLDDLEELLADTDPVRLRARIASESDEGVAEIRRIFRSFGTCSIREPVDDLVALELVPIPERIR